MKSVQHDVFSRFTLVCTLLFVLFPLAVSLADVDQQTLKTVLLGLKHRDAVLPRTSGLWVSERVEYPQPDGRGEGLNELLPHRAALNMVQFVQTETGYWQCKYQQLTTEDETSAQWTWQFSDGETVYESRRLVLAQEEVRTDTDYERQVQIRVPQDPADAHGFVDLMGSTRGTAGFIARRIGSASPILLGQDEIDGYQCYVIECLHPPGVSTRYWVCPSEDYAVLKWAETGPEGAYEHTERAQRLGKVDGISVVMAASSVNRSRTESGTYFVSGRGVNQFKSLEACLGEGYVEALRAAIMPPGSRWFNPAALESGEVGDLHQVKEEMLDLRRAEELARRYNGATLMPE